MDIQVISGVSIPVADPPPVMDTILTWIGLDQEAARNCIWERGFGSFSDLMPKKEKDIRDLAESYERRTIGTEKSSLVFVAYNTWSVWFIGCRTSGGPRKFQQLTALSMKLSSVRRWTKHSTALLTSKRSKGIKPILSAKPLTPASSQVTESGLNESLHFLTTYQESQGVSGVSLLYVVREGDCGSWTYHCLCTSLRTHLSGWRQERSPAHKELRADGADGKIHTPSEAMTTQLRSIIVTRYTIRTRSLCTSRPSSTSCRKVLCIRGGQDYRRTDKSLHGAEGWGPSAPGFGRSAKRPYTNGWDYVSRVCQSFIRHHLGASGPSDVNGFGNRQQTSSQLHSRRWGRQ